MIGWWITILSAANPLWQRRAYLRRFDLNVRRHDSVRITFLRRRTGILGAGLVWSVALMIGIAAMCLARESAPHQTAGLASQCIRGVVRLSAFAKLRGGVIEH